jgi:hypothetical protein
VQVRRPVALQFLNPKTGDTWKPTLKPLAPQTEKLLQIREPELALRDGHTAEQAEPNFGLIDGE